MIQTRVVNGRGGRGLGEYIRWGPLGPGGDPAMSLQGRRGLSAYGDQVNLGEYQRWAPLGPGGDPQMSLQGRGPLGEVIRWAPLGPGGDPQMSLQGYGDYGDVVALRGRGLGAFPTTMQEIDWAQIGIGAVLGVGVGVGAYMLARQQKLIK